ncbi:MAG TPA: AsnC family transcriptional regulator [Candidatus Nanoarchaeia archaeon]|nr:AsnC family transcriptional regulator [Candidatus Nanoarchaeia archaeon]
MEQNEPKGIILDRGNVLLLDKRNQKILSMLMTNARVANAVIAKELQLSKSNIGRRIENLEASHIIGEYQTYIDATTLGFITSIVFIKTKCTQEQKEAYLTFLAEQREIYGVLEPTGVYDLVLAFYSKGTKQKETILENLLNNTCVKDFFVLSARTLFPPHNLFNVPAHKTPFPSFIHPASPISFDRLDLAFLERLSSDCRVSYVELADAFHISRETVRYRIHRLIKARVITKFQPVINLFLLGFEAYMLMIKLVRPTQKENIATFIASTHQCNTLLLTETLFDIVCFINLKNNKEFRAFENELTSRFKDAIYEYSFEIIKKQNKLDWFPRA